MIRKRQLISLLLLVTTACYSVVSAQTVKAENKVSVDSSAILESLLCIVRSNPWLCIRQQAGRMLDNWEEILDFKKHEMMEEADRESQQRALKDDGKKKFRETPSSLIHQIEDGLGTISDYVSDGVDGYVAGKGLKSDDEQARPKKHLHHILKLGNTDNNGTNAGLARTAAEFDDEVAAVEDGLVDYGFDAGLDKAIGRGKQVGGQAVGFGGDEQNGPGFVGKRKGKKKKTYIKLFMLGAALKGKIELLLKILSFHLQLKFFAIAALGLLINIGRFWFDLKKQPQPQKVIYYEHAQHQHHYDDHSEDFGGYWKRSLHGNRDEDGGYYSQDRNDRLESEYPYHRPSQYAPVPNSPSHYPYDPHIMAYHQQRPYA
ncbi:uncharacterized protein LOC131688721 isoform X1 [Topomyia yanbarensis]|uniref:uncharacterized protein LOC131688721 isoform X1 n=1 Tax=Topomyia yanbarensis TaxID=2498891 RepID=UPI00273BC7AF|nr:uncharacterized protein LOC131688721 isoform X1 [Topomyia yanbarensis]